MFTRLKFVCFASFICLFFEGCSTYSVTKPMYPSVNGGEKSTLVINNMHNPSEFSTARLRMAVYVDGFRITTQDVLLKGITKIDISEGNHQVTIKAFPKGMIPMKEDVVFTFDSEAGKTYRINILKGDKLWDPGFKLTYEGFDEEESATWPVSRYARSV